jgi:hypothetical protein
MNTFWGAWLGPSIDEFFIGGRTMHCSEARNLYICQTAIGPRHRIVWITDPCLNHLREERQRQEIHLSFEDQGLEKIATFT